VTIAIEKLPECRSAEIKQNIDLKIQFVMDCLETNEKKNRTTESSKDEYDGVKEREHDLYDSNSECEVDCCGMLCKMGFRHLRDYVSKLIIDRVPQDRGEFLDFGSGNGFNARCMSEKFPNATINCIDISESRMQYARDWIGERNNIVYRQMDGSNLEFPDSSFDFVYTCHALEQMESVISKAVSEIIRVMKHRAVLVEPIWENADLAQRYYLARYDYVRSLLSEIKKHTNVKIIENFAVGIQSTLNPSSIIVLEKSV
jgi:ubiquinone/menaquinone biosynthesis C-methylase UbiE